MYTIKKAIFYPKETSETWEERAYLTMSMSNTRFKNKVNLKQIIEWISNKTSSCDLIVGDYLDRHNQQAIFGFDEKKAIESSLRIGDDLIKLFKEESRNYPKIKFRIRRIKEFYERFDFKDRMNRLETLLKKNQHFSELTEETIDKYFNRKSLTKLIEDKTRVLSRKYIIEELVVYEMLVEEDLMINIYPGNQLPVLKEIVLGKLPEISQQLEKMKLIEIKFKKSNIK